MSLGITAAGAAHLRDLLRNAATPVPVYHVALVCTQPPGFTIGGEELDEPSYAEYARGELVNDSASWQVSDNLMTNLGEVTYPTALNEWGQVSYVAVCDSPREIGGRVLFCGELDRPLFVTVGDQAYLEPGTVGIDVAGVQWMSEGMP